MKTPEEFAQVMSEKNPNLAKRPEGAFAVSRPKELKKKNFLWMDLENKADAMQASNMGIFAAGLIAVVNAVVATISVVTSATVLGNGPAAYVDAVMFAVIAMGIHFRSRIVAVAGLVLFLLEKIAQFALQPKSAAGLGMAFMLLICFINGVRGTFAYRRYVRDAEQDVIPCS